MSNRAVVWLKIIVHALCLLPALWLLDQYHNGSLAMQADPVNYITHFTGDWALWLLLADLAITPIRRLHTSLGWMVRFRRMVGLYVFLYATLHLLTYVLLFSGYDMPAAVAGLRAGHPAELWTQLKLIWPSMVDDVEKRRFIQVGLAAYVILLALTATSPKRVMRAMGGKNWQRLHRLIYVAGIAACIHYWWLVKAGVRTPWKVTAVLIVLLALRLGYSFRKRIGVEKRTVRAEPLQER
ncbi:MAG: sulfoxide reductase heme-binding subunit YedZ [Acidobacteria bacterium]|nr:sulfoxide reductase heme-binding subunit YedZ [Acidobacteriota bacterium]